LALWVATLLLCSDGYLLLTFNDVQNRPNVCFALKAACQRRPLGWAQRSRRFWNYGLRLAI